MLSHLYDSLANKQLAYYYYKSLKIPNVANLPVIATKRFAIKACYALKKYDEAKKISIAIGDSK